MFGALQLKGPSDGNTIFIGASETEDEIFDLVYDLARIHGVAIGVVLHDLDEAAALADHVVVLSEGRIAAAGPAHEALDAELLSDVYSIPIVTHTDPLTGRLRTRAVGRHSDS